MLDWKDCSAVEQMPGKGGGEWLFRGTRVPLRALFKNLEGGASLSEFLEWYPQISREQAELVLRYAGRSAAAA